MLDEGHGALHQRAEIVVHRPEMQALQVGDIAANMEGEYLARAAFQDLVAAKPAVEHEAGLRRTIPLADDVVICAHLPDGDGKIENRCLFLSGKAGDAFEFSNERIEDVRHVLAPGGGGREHSRSLSHRRRKTLPMIMSPYHLL